MPIRNQGLAPETIIAGAARFTVEYIRAVRSAFPKASLTINQLIVLITVVDSKVNGRVCSHSCIRRATGLSKATVSRAIGTLRHHRMVDERRSLDDARRCEVVPSAKFLSVRARFLARHFGETFCAFILATIDYLGAAWVWPLV
jgi:DNA-binding MarR family transcriptional regulator